MTSTATTVTYALRPLFEAFLEEQHSTGDADLYYFIRDYNGRPWIVSFDHNGDPFVASIPYEDKDSGLIEEPDRFHGGLDLPTYPVRIVEES
ncbi:hypothetical protein [Oerskovia enterophila]|uniref:hypothetical protein n=1 Tax=Oerskovia enterophila TaxID=43678 RepID=UPI0038059004